MLVARFHRSASKFTRGQVTLSVRPSGSHSILKLLERFQITLCMGKLGKSSRFATVWTVKICPGSGKIRGRLLPIFRATGTDQTNKRFYHVAFVRAQKQKRVAARG